MADYQLAYWKECISLAADDCGLILTKEQIESLASSVQGGHENYGMAFGHDVASANFVSDDKRALDRLRAENEQRRVWEASTEPCTDCTTKGWVLDGWGRDHRCMRCDGKGRI